VSEKIWSEVVKDAGDVSEKIWSEAAND